MNDLDKIIAVRNPITLICFTVLSVVFGKWWIIFLVQYFGLTENDYISRGRRRKAPYVEK